MTTTYNTQRLIHDFLTQGGQSPGIDAEALDAEFDLVAAAPDLLAALLPLVECMPINGGMVRFDGEELAAARAAIAKAKGE